MAKELLAYIDRPSPIHRLSGTTKLIVFLLWSMVAMLTYDTRVLVALFFASLFIFYLSKIKIKEIGFILLFILFFLFLNNIAIYLFSPQEGVKIYGSSHLLAEFWGRYNLTWEQLFYHFNITLKYFVVIPAALLFIVTTHPSEFAASLNKIKVPYKISYSIALAFRYIPDIQRDFRTIAHAQQARGIDLSRNEKLGKRLKNFASILSPLILSSIERIEVVTNTLELRGFGKHKKRTWYSGRPFQRLDYWTLVISVGIAVLALWITFQDGSRFYNPFQ